MSLLLVALLGAFHGINPGMGWLFGVFMAVYKKSKLHLFLTILTISTGHILSVIPVIAAYQAIRPYWDLVPLAASILLISFGVYGITRHYKHARIDIRVGYKQLFSWGFILGFSHGSGISLLPFTNINLLILTTVHYAATLITMLLIAFITTYIIGLTILKRIWINFDLLWGAFLIIIGAGILIDVIQETYH